jgi:hypothetical protein
MTDIQALLVSAKGILTSHLPLASHSTGADHSESEEEEEWGALRRKGPKTTTIRHGTAAKGRISDSDDDFDL